VREHRPADLAAEVDFQNRYGRPAERRALSDIERWESLADPNEVRLRLVLESGGGLAGVAGTGDGGKWRPPDGSWSIGMRLDDHWKRKGIGTVLADALERFARESGAPALNAGLRGDEPAGIAFAQGRGYVEFHRRQSSYLDLAAFDASRYEDPDAIAARTGHRLASYEGLAALESDGEALRRRIHELHNATWADVPTPEIPAPPSFEDFGRFIFESPTFDRLATTFALRGDDLVGLTLADVNGSGIGYTFMTGVRKDARGNRLSLAMKLRAIAALKQRGVGLFGTTNDEGNVPMLSVNRKLGYVPEPPSIRMKKPLAIA
ncbi:MAG: GNAT family N-acetyltransferase, partial [Chloroflexota bacterium]|nr:GNAT family N-acetyltransferase [Chloroflexota bacterium]